MTLMDNPETDSGAPTSRRRRVLIVDDNEGLREVIGMLAEDHGFRPVPAGDGLEGMRVLENGNDFAIGIIDVKMPRMDGIALLEEVRRKYPTMPVVLISGSEIAAADHAARNDPNVVVLPKPFTFEALLAVAPELDT